MLTQLRVGRDTLHTSTLHDSIRRKFLLHWRGDDSSSKQTRWGCREGACFQYSCTTQSGRSKHCAALHWRVRYWASWLCSCVGAFQSWTRYRDRSTRVHCPCQSPGGVHVTDHEVCRFHIFIDAMQAAENWRWVGDNFCFRSLEKDLYLFFFCSFPFFPWAFSLQQLPSCWGSISTWICVFLFVCKIKVFIFQSRSAQYSMYLVGS